MVWRLLLFLRAVCLSCALLLLVLFGRVQQPLAHGSTVLSLLDGTDGCDLGFSIVWFRFRLMRRCLAFQSELLCRIYSIVTIACEGEPGAWACTFTVGECC